MSGLGFVIIANSEPDQLLRLTKRLGSMFPDGKISIAFDFGQTQLDERRFPDFVSFVRPHQGTKWGHISVIHAGMRALQWLYEKHDPDWFVMLSGADYPVTDADKILKDLRTGGYDVYLDAQEITPPAGMPLSLGNREADYNFNEPGWSVLAYDRYVAKLLHYPWLSRRMRLKWGKLFIRQPSLIWPFHPFTASFRCFGGEAWFTANRHTARVLLDEYEHGDRLIKHFSKCIIPEEAYYHTVICNQEKASRE